MELPGYDAWKTRLPDWWDRDDEPDGINHFYCDACRDIGWLCMEIDDEVAVIIPCTECSAEPTLDDIEEDEA